MIIDTTTNHILALIARAGISQREVARRMQISDRTVRRYCKYGGTVQFVMALEWIAGYGSHYSDQDLSSEEGLWQRE